jgi:hypothetical protein
MPCMIPQCVKSCDYNALDSPLVPGEPRLQRSSRLFWLGCFVPAPQIRDAVHMHINPDAFVSSPSCTHAKICHLGANARERHQALNGIWNIRVPFVAQYLGRLLDVFGLEIVETDLVDEGVQGGAFDGQHGFEIEALSQSAVARSVHADMHADVLLAGGLACL